MKAPGYPFDEVRMRERAELEPNQDYWDKTRIPRVDKVILLPMPEATTRLAALRTGQVEWIAVPRPEWKRGRKGAIVSL